MRIAIVLALTWVLPCLESPIAAAQTADAELASQWNATVLEIAEAEDNFLTLKGLRTVTMMHLAMHDALNSIGGRYEPYALQDRAPSANDIAAATSAAFAIAVDQYPEQRRRFAELQSRWLDTVGPAAEIDAGLELGAAAAAAILAARASDGWNSEAEYQWHPMAPGVYAEFHEHSNTPQGFIFGAGWAKARGFALERPDQFRVSPPPDISSSAYTQAYNEVKAFGRFQSIGRTPDQTHLALWWKDFAENSHNRLARDLVAKEAISLVDATRLFALLNMGIFDAYVSSFSNKFHYNHWRPYTAIRWAANDDNPDTEPEVTWVNTHRHTYAFPSYPSAHGTACAAAMTAFADVFGSDYAFTMRIPMVDVAGPFSGKMEMHPPTREFSGFYDAATECGLSRVYLGIHFRYDSIEGVKLGKVVGKNVVANFLRKKIRNEQESSAGLP
jgi:hypothetical protein